MNATKWAERMVLGQALDYVAIRRLVPPHPIHLPLRGGEGARRAGEGKVHAQHPWAFAHAAGPWTRAARSGADFSPQGRGRVILEWNNPGQVEFRSSCGLKAALLCRGSWKGSE